MILQKAIKNEFFTYLFKANKANLYEKLTGRVNPPLLN